MSQEIRTRFAPSPTGQLHIGGVRTALFSWLHARHFGGKFILRIEDTDAERSTDDNTKQILASMEWLGLDWDEGPFFQSDRLDIYMSYILKLVEEGKAYWCDCTPDNLEKKRSQALAEGKKPKYDGTCRSKGLGPGPGRVVRFLMPDSGVTSFDDMIKGRITMDNAELDDLILLRSDEMPTYNFTVVIDDATMNMTHVIRGDDHVNNTPRQVKIYEALGFELPLFAHVPMILGPDKTKLSKRHGATSAMAYQEMGYLPEALVNYLVRLSWSHGDQEIFTLDELKKYFDIHDVGRAAAVFNPEKLLWLNHHYIKTGDPQRLAGLVADFITKKGYQLPEKEYIKNVVIDVRDRTKTLEEIPDFGGFYFQEIDPVEDLKKQFYTPDIGPVFKAIKGRFELIDQWDKEHMEEAVKAILEEFNLKFKTIAQPMRIALTGKTVSPGLFEIMLTLGKTTVLSRLEKALSSMQT
jgi:glutamyl-tRNA synthetase